jgi:hypothetical protein
MCARWFCTAAFDANHLFFDALRGREYGLMATKCAVMDHAVRDKTAQATVNHVIGFNGRRLTLADLPLPETKRWVIRRKAEVVAAVCGGLLSLEEACSLYALSSEEVLSWQHCIDRFGIAGLRTTRTQFYLGTRPESLRPLHGAAMWTRRCEHWPDW